MKRILALILSAVLMLSISVPAYATGDENIDGGGGNMGSGTSTSYWNPGMDGVRVSVINVDSHAVVGNVIDLTNKTPASGVIHFGKVSKLSYNAGRSLSPVVGNYSYINPSQSLPRIISSGSYPASIDAIRSYFTDEQVIRAIAGYVGMDFDTLICGDYKIVIEPIAYLVYNGANYAMTATEAALYDQVVDGKSPLLDGVADPPKSPARYLFGGSRPRVSCVVRQHHKQGQQRADHLLAGDRHRPLQR